LIANHYTDTWQYRNNYNQLQAVIDTIFRYKGEESILAGEAVSQVDLDAQIQGIFENNRHYIEQQLYRLGYTDISYKMLWDKFQEDHKTEIANVKSNIIQNQLEDFRNAVYEIEHTPNLYYCIKVNETVLSNTNYESVANSKYSYSQIFHEIDRKTVVPQAVFAFDENYINDLNIKFLAAKHDATVLIIQGSVCLLVFLLALVYLIFAAGKKSASPQGIHHVFADRIYNEIIAFLLFLSGCAVVACGFVIIDELFNKSFMYILFVSSVLIAVAFMLILVRHIKDKTLLKHTIIFTVFHFIFKSVKKVYDAGQPMVKAVLLVAVLVLFTAIPFVFLVTLPLALVFTYMQVAKYIAVKNGVKRVKSGTYDQKIEIKGSGEVSALAADINDISAGLGLEVERRMKSERLKTELIVNVSHDIKTPLTSVITYVDLLKKENINSESARKYIDVIAGKANRLKTLIDDLFDASKAASGNITVNLDEVDINALITQGFGELDEQIKSSSLDFKVNMPEGKITVYADGRLTWRVLENLLSNVFKYSLANSRVYIDVSEDEQNAYIEIKNISATELNIPEDEIMERFKRGDESRGSEGSGLGLDIAKSLMLCQNGELTIKVDGDLFKVKLRLPKIG
ncbi:MAG: sensor histidine kinase, partial [Eubacteriales bacterium]|nr:sensor histidine kinase [Eubacteriales bacterium]